RSPVLTRLPATMRCPTPPIQKKNSRASQVPRLIGLHAPHPNTPESPMAVHPLPRHQWQASAVLADWPLSLYVTRPNRVRFRYGSQFRLARHRVADYSNSTRLLGYLGERVIPRVSSFQLTR